MLRMLWDWTMRASWRTWAAHGLIAFTLAWPLGAWTIMVFYALREVEQVALSYSSGLGVDWRDAIADVAAPFLACGLASWLGW